MSDQEIIKRLETIEAQNNMILLYIQKKIELSPELKEIFNSIEKMAEEQSRSRSNMIRVLIEKAMKPREG